MSETLRDRRVRYARTLLAPQGPADLLLAQAGDVAGLRVLVLGSSVAATMCALMQTECRSAETRMPGCRTGAGSADLVLVPSLTEENVDRVVSQAGHALVGGGRIVLALEQTPRELRAHLALMLMGVGFDLPAVRRLDGHDLLLAELPGCAPLPS